MQMKTAGWSELPKSLFESILEMLSTMDIIRVKMVCTSWFSMVDAYVSSPVSANMRRSLVLMVPHQLEGGENDKCFSFLCVANNKVYKLTNISEEIHDGLCVGSSHGWLLFLDKNMELCLYNPFSKARKQVPPLRAFPHIQNIKFRPPSNYGIFINEEYSHCVVQSSAQTAREMPKLFIEKAVLFSKTNPVFCDNKFGLLVMYVVGHPVSHSQLAFYDSEVGQWTELGKSHNDEEDEHYAELLFYGEGYHDIIYHNSRFYALSGCLLEIWDYDGHFPKKIKEIYHSLYHRIWSIQQSLSFPSLVQCYIVESQGKILHVARFIVSLFNNGVEIGPNDKHQSCKTVSFLVHMMDFEQEKWVEVESLDGHAIFLGRNHSQLFSSQEISEIEENSIYFTDYCCQRRAYNGQDMGVYKLLQYVHDIGIYNLGSKTVSRYFNGEMMECGSPLFWLFADLH